MAALACLFVFSETSAGQKRNNELKLAGLRPGQDRLARAKRLYGVRGAKAAADDPDVWNWTDPCQGQELRAEGDTEGLIQVITVTAVAASQRDCRQKASQGLPGKSWRTGRGLALRDLRARAIALYGWPDSRGPSTGENRELELLYYAFDWAGSDVPQVMEVYCDHHTGRVVQITLAYPSL